MVFYRFNTISESCYQGINTVLSLFNKVIPCVQCAIFSLGAKSLLANLGWRLELLGLSQDRGCRHVVALVGGGETWGCSRLAHHRVMWGAIQCLLESGMESAFVPNVLGICWNFRNKERKLALSGWISLFRSWGWTLLKAPCLQSESDAGWGGSDGAGWPLRPYPLPLPSPEVCHLWQAFIPRCDPHFLSLRQSASCFGGENSSRNTQLQAVVSKIQWRFHTNRKAHVTSPPNPGKW